MNKKISFPIAIIIIVVCAVLAGLIVWQYGLIPGIGPSGPLPKPPEKEVTITTDKTEYEQGEVIKITVKNGLDKNIIYITTCIVEPYRVQLFLNDKWLDSVEIEPSARCLVVKEPQFTYEKVKTGQSVEFSWDQKGILPDLGQASLGRYRVLFSYKKSETSEESKTIYSNEFTIKEKEILKNCNDYEMPMTMEEIQECTCPEGYEKFNRLMGAYCATNSQKPCKAHSDCPKGEHCISADRKNWFCTGQFAGCYYQNPENPEGPMLCAD